MNCLTCKHNYRFLPTYDYFNSIWLNGEFICLDNSEMNKYLINRRPYICGRYERKDEDFEVQGQVF